MTADMAWKEWRPRFAPHVLGLYIEREYDDNGQPLPQKWAAVCEKCGRRFQGACMTGAIRGHITRFAAQHAHADPLAAPRVVRPTSLRVKPEP